jgi:hypothetical protein
MGINDGIHVVTGLKCVGIKKGITWKRLGPILI